MTDSSSDYSADNITGISYDSSSGNSLFSSNMFSTSIFDSGGTVKALGDNTSAIGKIISKGIYKTPSTTDTTLKDLPGLYVTSTVSSSTYLPGLRI